MNISPAVLYHRAHAAGVAAGEACIPRSMVVGTAKDLFSNDIDESKPTYFVSEGVCGFAWVNIKPGNSKFATWLKKNDLARKSYYGGVDVWVRGFGQSMARKEAYADAFAKVLRENGVDRAYSMSRMD